MIMKLIFFQIPITIMKKTTAASLISDWQLICGYEMFKTHFDELQTKISELEAKLQALNDSAYTKSDTNEW